MRLLQLFSMSSFTLNSFLSFPHWSSKIMSHEAQVPRETFLWNLIKTSLTLFSLYINNIVFFCVSILLSFCNFWSYAGSLWWPTTTGQSRNTSSNWEGEHRNLIGTLVLIFDFLFMWLIINNLNFYKLRNIIKRSIKYKYKYLNLLWYFNSLLSESSYLILKYFGILVVNQQNKNSFCLWKIARPGKFILAVFIIRHSYQGWKGNNHLASVSHFHLSRCCSHFFNICYYALQSWKV